MTLADERVRIAIIGLNWGMMMIRQLRSPQNSGLFDVAGVCAAHFDKAQRIAAEVGTQAYPDLDAVLADDRIDAVGLFVPPDIRADMLHKTIAAGKNIITTKPLDVNPDRGLAMLLEARRRGRVLHLNSPHPILAPDLAQIRRWESEYDLGRMVACRGEMWAPYHEQADGSWYDDPERAPGAPIFRLGIYPLTDIVELYGLPETVYLQQSRIRTGRPTADNAQIAVQYASGALGTIFTSLCVADGQPRRSGLVLNYERGTIYRNVGLSDRPSSRDLVRLELTACPDEKDRIVQTAEIAGGSGTYNWELFYRAARGEKIQGEIEPEDVVASLRVIEAMGRSERSGLPERVRPGAPVASAAG
jgi:predicted dehydrogenase